jgi:hypothetical protein
MMPLRPNARASTNARYRPTNDQSGGGGPIAKVDLEPAERVHGKFLFHTKPFKRIAREQPSTPYCSLVFFGVTALWLCLLLTGDLLSAAAATEPSPRGAALAPITLREGKLSVHVAGTPLRQVMIEISRLNNARIIWLSGEGQEEQVSVQFTDLPLVEGLQRILQHKNFILFYERRATGAQVTQIWISSDRNTAQPQAPQEASVKVSPFRRAGTGAEQNGPATASDGTVMQSVMQMGLSDPDPSTRANAAVYLGEHLDEDPQAKETLEQIARNDTNVRVRKTAAEALQQIE